MFDTETMDAILAGEHGPEETSRKTSDDAARTAPRPQPTALDVAARTLFPFLPRF